MSSQPLASGWWTQCLADLSSRGRRLSVQPVCSLGVVDLVSSDPLESEWWFSVYNYISSIQSPDRLGRRGDMRDDSADILFQSFVQEAHVSSSRMGRVVHPLTVSIRHFLCRPRLRPPSKVP